MKTLRSSRKMTSTHSKHVKHILQIVWHAFTGSVHTKIQNSKSMKQPKKLHYSLAAKGKLKNQRGVILHVVGFLSRSLVGCVPFSLAILLIKISPACHKLQQFMCFPFKELKICILLYAVNYPEPHEIGDRQFKI